MKVLIVTSDFPPMLSGVGDYTDRLADALARQGAAVTVLCNAGPDDGAARRFEVRREIGSWKWNRRDDVLNHFRGFDVINLQYPCVSAGRSMVPNLLPTLAKRVAPVVVTLHDFRVMRTRWRARAWPMLQWAAGVLHVDEGDWPAVRRWMKLGAPPHAHVPIASNVEVLPVDAELRRAWRAGLGLADDELGIAYFGIIYPHKGLDELLAATAALRGEGRKVKLVVVGDFDRDEPWVHELRGRLQNTEGVTWVGGASLARVSECLHACDLAALPFHSGTSTNRSSMLATLAHGLPTVTTRGHVTPPDFEANYPVALVPPKDAAALTNALRTLVAHPAALAAQAARTRAFASAVTWDAVARKTLLFFEDVVGRRRGN